MSNAHIRNRSESQARNEFARVRYNLLLAAGDRTTPRHKLNEGIEELERLVELGGDNLYTQQNRVRLCELKKDIANRFRPVKPDLRLVRSL